MNIYLQHLNVKGARVCLIGSKINWIRNIIKISLNKFTSKNRISFFNYNHTQILRMDTCNSYFANTFFLNASSEAINKILIKCKQAINTSLDNWEGLW